MSDDNLIDFGEARAAREPERKEKAARELRKQFQRAMGMKSVPARKANGGKGKGPTGRGGKGPKGKGGRKR